MNTVETSSGREIFAGPNRRAFLEGIGASAFLVAFQLPLGAESDCSAAGLGKCRHTHDAARASRHREAQRGGKAGAHGKPPKKLLQKAALAQLNEIFRPQYGYDLSRPTFIRALKTLSDAIK